MKTQSTITLNPLLAARITPAAAVTTAFLSPVAVGAPGDLDPDFGDLGRLGPILNGPAWSLESLEDGTTLVGGGDTVLYCYYYWYCYDPVTTNFVSLLSDTGSTDPGFTAATVADAEVFDVARQPDGQVVAVGRRVRNNATVSQLTAFRLQSDGLLDTTFGANGTFTLSTVDHGDLQVGTSVALEPDGRIVIAGSRGSQVIVLRLLPDGSFDDTFGTLGVFAGPDTYDFSSDSSGARTTIVRAAAGGYRVTASNAAGCQVFALTPDGVLDDTFGTSGIATVDAPSGATTSCNAMTQQSDGSLLVAGIATGQGFASRLLEDGQPDPGFAADAVSDAMSDATAVAVADDGAVFVAGNGVSGASIMRLLANGGLDSLFGNDGSTLIDLESDFGTSTVVHDMAVRADGRVVAAGGEHASRRAFVVRLQGAGGGNSPGVLGITSQHVMQTAEGSNDVVVNVRRTGGASGEVSVAYRSDDSYWHSAMIGADFADVSGRLTWLDGDTADQQISVPILSDGSIEHPEWFTVTLSDTQGGAGLGTIRAAIEIAADGGPHGQLAFVDNVYAATEGQTVQVAVRRDYYSSGAVSVTVTPVSGTATAGEDFAANPVTVFWADGDWDWKTADFAITNDTTTEPFESFSVQLSDAGGGAVIGQQSVAQVRIQLSDQPVPAQRPRGGSGSFGYLSLLFLGLMSLLRRVRGQRWST